MSKTPSVITEKANQMASPDKTIAAINQMFAEFELVFHNQYHKAFSTKEKEDWAKKLWYSNLKEFSAEQIINATHRAIKESDFLPTVHGVLKYCAKQGPILPLLVELPDQSKKLNKKEKQEALAKLRKKNGI